MVKIPEPFGATMKTAERAVVERKAELLARHAANPEEWMAFHVGEHGGSAFIALFNPDSLAVSTLSVDGFQISRDTWVTALFGPGVSDVAGVADGLPFTAHVGRL